MSVVVPGHSYATSLNVTPADTGSNLRMDGVAAAYLHNAGAAAVTATITNLAAVDRVIQIASGESFQLSHLDKNVKSTGTSSTATIVLKAFY